MVGKHTLTQIFNPQKYVKLIVALLGAGASTLATLGVTSGHLNTTQIVNVAIAVVAAFQVWYVTETSDNPSGKAVIAGIAAALIAIQSFVTGSGHLDLAEWMQVGVAALTATGLLAVPTRAANS